MLSIIVPTYNRSEVLSKSLSYIIEAIRNIDCEVVIINDSKTSKVENHFHNERIRVFDNPKQGVASARNLGAKYATGEYLLFVDDDILISQQNLISCLHYLETFDERCYLFNWFYPSELIDKIEGSKFGRFLIKYGFTNLKGWMKDDWKEGKTVFKISMGASYFLPISKRNFDKVGGYNERFPHAGAEDREFCQRVINNNITFYMDTSETVFHNESDRVNIRNWMLRKKRNSKTQKVLSKLTGIEKLKYSQLKKMRFKVLSKFKILIWALYYTIPNHRIFDAITFTVINVLLATNIFEGYHRR